MLTFVKIVAQSQVAEAFIKATCRERSVCNVRRLQIRLTNTLLTQRTDYNESIREQTREEFQAQIEAQRRAQAQREAQEAADNRRRAQYEAQRAADQQRQAQARAAREEERRLQAELELELKRERERKLKQEEDEAMQKALRESAREQRRKEEEAARVKAERDAARERRQREDDRARAEEEDKRAKREQADIERREGIELKLKRDRDATQAARLKAERDAAEARRLRQEEELERDEERVRRKREQNARHHAEKDDVRLRPEAAAYGRNVPNYESGRASYVDPKQRRDGTYRGYDEGYASPSPGPAESPRGQKREHSPRVSGEYANLYDAEDDDYARPSTSRSRPYAGKPTFVEPQPQPKKKFDWDN